MDSYNLTHTGAELDSAVGRALEGFAAADAATEAAKAAAKLAEDTAAEVQEKLDNGEFIGPIGKSGVYVGSGDMPEGYTVQVDPTGDMLCYTAGESDSRYLRATEIRRPFTGGGITLTDADDAAFGGVTVLGATTEAGTGDKSPDNPYTLAGVQPTKVTVCGRNLLTYPYTSKTKTEVGVTFTDLGNGAINCSGTCTIAQGVVFSFRGAAEPFTCFPGFTYSVSGCPAGGGDSSVGTYCIRVVEIKNGTIIWNNRYTDTGHGITFQVAEEKQFVINFTVWGFATVNNLLVRPQIEISPAATPYAPYTGQTVPLPALEPLYGDGTVCDEYDAATGVENRRWGRVELDGTEAWITRTSGTGVYGYALPDVFDAPAAAGVCTHFKFIKNGASGTQTAVCVASASTRKDLSVFTTIATLDDFKAWLAAQATAGTPMTVAYQLDAPVVTQRGPQRIPTYPGYTNLMLDVSAEGAVQYPISAAMQWDAKADKAAVYDRDTADSRFAGVLSGTASGPVAGMEDVSPTGALRRAAVLGATAETGEGDKSPDNPYTLAGVQPTKVTVCGKNLLDSKAVNGSSNGVTWTVQSDGCIKVTGTATGTVTIDILPPRNTPYFWMSQGYTPSGSVSLAIYAIKEDGTKEYGAITNLGIKVGLTPITGKIGILRVYKQYLSGDAADGTISPYIGLEPDHTYVPYAGQTIALPALAPLYGDGTVNDEYDAVSGVETRRWKQVVFDGTEAWAASATGTAGKYRASLSIADILPTATFSQVSSCRCSHYTTVSADNTYNLKVGISANYGTSHGIFVYDDAYDTQDMTDWKAYLAAQYAAGTPVTVVYQLDEPVITQHDPARILPPAPVCRVFADAGNAEVGYNRDVNIVIPKLEAALAELLGGGAQPMT